MSTRLSLLLLFLIGVSHSCTDSFQEFEATFGDFTLDTDRKIASFNGTIDEMSQMDLQEMINLYETVEEIRFENAKGFSSTSAAFSMANIIRSKNIRTAINESGEISQLGTYVFLGGVERSRVDGGKIGVSSWQTVDGTEANSLSEDDMAHEEFLTFLKDMGWSEDIADAFYFFSLNAANSTDTYYLSDEEVQNFELLN